MDFQKAFDTDHIPSYAVSKIGFMEFQMIGLNPICLIVVSMYL